MARVEVLLSRPFSPRGLSRDCERAFGQCLRQWAWLGERVDERATPPELGVGGLTQTTQTRICAVFYASVAVFLARLYFSRQHSRVSCGDR